MMIMIKHLTNLYYIILIIAIYVELLVNKHFTRIEIINRDND